jgi:SWI/SNF-related matrix-associated actin-dependent regulator of chromatin subfamily A-like protein 1
VAFLKALNYRGIIADDMGLGKTCQAIGAIITDPQELLPAVVVGPAIVFTNWQDELRRWLPAVKVWPMASRSSPPPPRGFKGVIVAKYSTVAEQVDAILSVNPRYLIVDEAHRIKNPQAQQTQAVTELAACIPHVVLLTGTPIKNNVVELWNLLSTVTGTFSDEEDFTEQYATTAEGNFRGRPVRKVTGVQNVEDLRLRLKSVMIRRLKSQVAKFLPDKTRQYIPVEVSPQALREYRKAEKDFERWVEREMGRRVADVIAQASADGAELSKQDRASIHEEADESVRRAVANQALVKVGYLKRLVGRMKVPAVLEIITDFVENDVPALVFAVHREVIDEICAGLDETDVQYGVIDGGVSANERGNIVRAFQAGQLDIVIGSEAMKEGVNLTRASNVLLAERFWTSADEEQAEDRAHRLGQKNAVVITIPEVPGTIDDRIHELIDSKRKLIDTTVGGARVAETGSTRSALLGTFGVPVKPQRPAPQQRRTKVIYHDDVSALVFDKAWTPARAKQWSTVNGFRGRIERVEQHLVLRIRTVRGKTRTVKVAPGVTAVIGV